MAIPSISSYPMPSSEEFPANKVGWAFAPDRAVLLIHDMQDYFLRFYDQDGPLAGRLVDNIAALRVWCRERRVPVVYTAQPERQSPEERGLLTGMWGDGLTEHPHLQRVVAALAPEEGDTVLVKWRYSAFQRSPLEEMMRKMERDQLVICGVYGHIGCMTTALDAFMRDIKAFLVGDAIADFSRDDHLMALRYVAGRCGRVVSCGQLMALPASSGLTREAVKVRILAAVGLDEAQFDPDENLLDYGLDSVQTMAMVTEWRKLGIEIGFADLAGVPSLSGWWAVIEARMAGRRG
jgi:bifunctional isochorismate lyase/aryl carrier protein